ncbi:bifunctional phosphoribosyl-AMP cyclohydrolase/phosphoribosyl-ATP diphosphatase HisIE [Thorsellia kenyensis]|uniref:Histidine biosynthesis bifunctional protein HisIE n=1 Tax=Thorsellia kenyensis TaxID=1549888 RepID=A0ABV6C870_9GAMM
MKKEQLISQINWDKVDNLVPAIIQHHVSGQVLMLGYMNKEALCKTFDEKKVTFFSRTKERLWTKGETSEHFLHVINAELDCDADTLLFLVNPIGPTCHKGNVSCFEHTKTEFQFLHELENIIASRKGADPSTSYTASLYAKGTKRIAQKVGEEGVETALAATVKDIHELKNEAADLVYHLLVLLQDSDLNLTSIINQLKERH